jgi:hypothetical protein
LNHNKILLELGGYVIEDEGPTITLKYNALPSISGVQNHQCEISFILIERGEAQWGR